MELRKSKPLTHCIGVGLFCCSTSMVVAQWVGMPLAQGDSVLVALFPDLELCRH